MRFFTGRTSRLLPRLAACSSTLGGLNLAHCGKHEDVERFKQEAARTAQLKEATVWCKENNKRGYAAAHRLTDDGEKFWPLVTQGSCNRRLDGMVDVDHPFSAHAVLTPQEEQDLVDTCKELSAHAQGVDREHLGKMVYDSLLLRADLNAGRDSTPLSHNARQILEAGEVGQGFFSRFFADHPDGTRRLSRPCQPPKRPRQRPGPLLTTCSPHGSRLGSSCCRLLNVR